LPLSFITMEPNYEQDQLALTVAIGRSLKECEYNRLRLDDAVNWARKEAHGTNRLPPHIPNDETLLDKIFTSVSELIPNLNGGTKGFVKQTRDKYQSLRKRADYLLKLDKIELDIYFGSPAS